MNVQLISFFKIPLSDVLKKTVVLQVFDWDKVSKTDSIGEVQSHLWQINLNSEVDEWKSLHKMTGTAGKPALQAVRPTVRG